MRSTLPLLILSGGLLLLAPVLHVHATYRNLLFQKLSLSKIEAPLDWDVLNKDVTKDLLDDDVHLEVNRINANYDLGNFQTQAPDDEKVEAKSDQHRLDEQHNFSAEGRSRQHSSMHSSGSDSDQKMNRESAIGWLQALLGKMHEHEKFYEAVLTSTAHSHTNPTHETHHEKGKGKSTDESHPEAHTSHAEMAKRLEKLKEWKPEVVEILMNIRDRRPSEYDMPSRASLQRQEALLERMDKSAARFERLGERMKTFGQDSRSKSPDRQTQEENAELEKDAQHFLEVLYSYPGLFSGRRGFSPEEHVDPYRPGSHREPPSHKEHEGTASPHSADTKHSDEEE